MENNSLCASLLKWLETFPGGQGVTLQQLTDGSIMANLLHQIAPEYFSQSWLNKIKPDVGDNWRLKVSNLRKVLQAIVDYYQEQLNQNIKHFSLPDLNNIGEHGDQTEMGRMLQLILGCAVNCENKQQYIEAIMNMEERVQKVIMEAIQELMLRESSPGILVGEGEIRADLGPASFHPHIKTILEQLETATLTRDETIQRCHELEQQISVINEEKTALASENEKLLNRLDAWETGGDLGTSTLRYKDLKKQIDGLQDELYKLETSRDEYRTKADLLDRENQELQTRNEELQRLADEARSLKDEVDALREMSERAVVYEGTMETYKKKLEELSDLKRQVRILEEKNSDYVQHNMELEEEVKKSGTWRPQLDLYKKQVADLHQKLAEEAKKTDRQIFENKKLMEKMEAILQEKDRLTKERDALKENIEELKCHVSTLTSPDTASRPPSDLSDVELLEVVPHEIREKLMRLQHENSMLKQRAAEGGSREQLPVLQTLVSDLQERQNSLTQENRWDSKGDLGYSKYKLSEECITPPAFTNYSFLDAYLSVDPNRKMKLFKRNLKWASESDLLILRQPKGLLPTNFLTSTLPLQQPRSLPPLSVASSSFATQTSKESPIVIHHIHEFKMSPSPTNEDSGCCRTSPSSCEGCEDTGCTSAHSPDYSGTMDSGISGIYSNTLESGMSGVFRCLSPVIPSIVEECTTHHMTDILPALGGHRVSSPSVMHHSHPAHTSCLNCCSPHVSQGDENGDGSSKEIGKASCVSPLPPPRPHTVCSLSSPYKYSQRTSPSSISSLRQLPVSQALSPHLSSSSSVFPLPSIYLPSTVVDLSLVYTQSNKSLLSKPALGGEPQCSPHTSSNSLTSPTYSSLNPLPVSSPQGRRTSSGFPRSSLPPESPTPHNSPRLPNSINATRNRSCKNSSLHNETATNIREIPVTQNSLVSRANSPEKESRSYQELNKYSLESGSNKNILVSSAVSSDSYVPPTSRNRVVSEESSKRLPSTDVPQLSENNSSKVGRNKDSEKIFDNTVLHFPAEKRELMVKSENVSISQMSNNKSSTEVKSDKTQVMLPKAGGGSSLASSVDKESKPVVEASEDLRVHNSSGYKYPAVVRSNNSAMPVSISKNTYTPTTVKKVNGKEKNYPKSNLISKNSSAAGSSNQGSPPHTKSGNHVKFSEPVVSQVTHSHHETIPNHYSPASPRERMLAVRSKSLRKTIPLKTATTKQEFLKSKKSTPEITLLSDTLFTHFEVSPKPLHQRLERDLVPSTTDTDTDLETLERKLTLGMYSAPLVSSESCASFSQDDGDEDPSATDYCTDNASDMDEYNPNQFKVYSDNRHHSKANINNVEGSRILEGNNVTALSERTSAPTLSHTYTFFRRQSKAKKQRKVAVKESLPLAISGGVVKPKNKTAKHMVAETFNAMFTLCTP